MDQEEKLFFDTVLRKTRPARVWDRYRDKRIVHQAGLRATKYGALGSFTLEEWLALCAHHDHKCSYCKSDEPLEADHIIPLSKGGSNYISNIQPLCRPCNSKKHAKLPEGSVPPKESPIPPSELLRKYTSHARHRLVIDLESARKLNILTRYSESQITVDQFVEALINKAWQELDEKMQEGEISNE